jgi:hypothetical protein
MQRRDLGPGSSMIASFASACVMRILPFALHTDKVLDHIELLSHMACRQNSQSDHVRVELLVVNLDEVIQRYPECTVATALLWMRIPAINCD